MNGHHENFDAIAPQIERLAAHLYGQPHPNNTIELEEVIRAFPELEAVAVERLLGRLDAREIVEFDDRRQRIRLLPTGRLRSDQERGAVFVLGLSHCNASI